MVGTPIGNLSDMSPRGINAFKHADIIFAEDTRTAKSLLHYFNISKPLRSYYKDNEYNAVHEVISELDKGRNIVLISEAGMPGLSDPGFQLVKKLIEDNRPFEVIPGPNAAALAAVSCGLVQDGRYLFAGFLPTKSTENEIKKFVGIDFSIVFYEAPHRINDTLKLLAKYFPFPIAVCRELTKMYEEVYWLNNEDEIDDINVKGEFCIVVNAPYVEKNKDNYNDNLANILVKHRVQAKTAVNILRDCGMKRNAAYELINNLYQQENE